MLNAKFIGEIEKIKFKPSEKISINVDKGMDVEKWSGYCKGIVIGDYPNYILVKHGKRKETYLKKDMLIDKIRIIREVKKYENKTA